MTPTEATALATRILQTFNGPSLADWEEELERLDAGRCGTAFVRLRREHDHTRLSIAHFLATYNALKTIDASNREPQCGWCDDTGWLPTAQHVNRNQVYSSVQPCTHCAEGRAREVSEAWTKAPIRDFVSDEESERIMTASRARFAARRPPDTDDAA